MVYNSRKGTAAKKLHEINALKFFSLENGSAEG
jgi:hypothetical protein